MDEVKNSISSSIRIGDDWTDEEEQVWDALFAQPHVQAGLSRLAEEAEQQIAQGNFEEGGFAVNQLKKSHEKHSPLRADKGNLEEDYGIGYWDE